MAEIISHAIDAANLTATDYFEEYGGRMTFNAKQHWRQSVIRTLVNRDPEIRIADDERADMGRIFVRFPGNQSEYLVKPMTWVNEHRGAPDAGVSAMLPSMGCGNHLLIYGSGGRALYVGHYEMVRKRERVEGGLVEMWAEPEIVFDQDDDQDWTVDLGEYQDEEEAGEE